jgi:hypothetical protein
MIALCFGQVVKRLDQDIKLPILVVTLSISVKVLFTFSIYPSIRRLTASRFLPFASSWSVFLVLSVLVLSNFDSDVVHRRCSVILKVAYLCTKSFSASINVVNLIVYATESVLCIFSHLFDSALSCIKWLSDTTGEVSNFLCKVIN